MRHKGLRVGDIVTPINFPNARSGIVRIVEGRKVAVRWVLGSGWNHTAVYDESELEVKYEGVKANEHLL